MSKTQSKVMKRLSKQKKINAYKASMDAQIDVVKFQTKKTKKLMHIKTPKQRHFWTHNEKVNLARSRTRKAKSIKDIPTYN